MDEISGSSEEVSGQDPQLDSSSVQDTIAQVLDSRSEGTADPVQKLEEKKPEPAKEDSKMAQKFAALSRRDKDLRTREKAASDRERSLEARIKELEAKGTAPAAAKEEPKDPIELRIKRDPFGTLKELGLDFDHLTKVALNEGKLTPEMQLHLKQEELDRKYASKLEALEKRLADKEDSEKKQSDERAQETAVREFKTSIKSEIESDKVAYEMLSIEGDDGLNLVFDVINHHYATTAAEAADGIGKIMSVKEAAEATEAALLDEAKKYAGLSKIKGLFGAPPAPAAVSDAGKKVTPTLSNAQNGTVPPSKKAQLSRDQELEEAAKLIKFQS